MWRALVSLPVKSAGAATPPRDAPPPVVPSRLNAALTDWGIGAAALDYYVLRKLEGAMPTTTWKSCTKGSITRVGNERVIPMLEEAGFTITASDRRLKRTKGRARRRRAMSKGTLGGRTPGQDQARRDDAAARAAVQRAWRAAFPQWTVEDSRVLLEAFSEAFHANKSAQKQPLRAHTAHSLLTRQQWKHVAFQCWKVRVVGCCGWRRPRVRHLPCHGCVCVTVDVDVDVYLGAARRVLSSPPGEPARVQVRAPLLVSLYHIRNSAHAPCHPTFVVGRVLQACAHQEGLRMAGAVVCHCCSP